MEDYHITIDTSTYKGSSKQPFGHADVPYTRYDHKVTVEFHIIDSITDEDEKMSSDAINEKIAYELASIAVREDTSYFDYMD